MSQSVKSLTENLAMAAFGAAGCIAAVVAWNAGSPLENLTPTESPYAARYIQDCTAALRPLESGVRINFNTLSVCVEREHAAATRHDEEKAYLGAGALAAIGGTMLIGGLAGATSGGRTRNREPDPNFDSA